MPQHEWDGTRLRFELAPNQWGSWVDLRGPAGKQGQTYYGAVPDSAGIADAPSDGSVYGRRNGQWSVIGAGGVTNWGAIGGAIADQSDLSAALSAKQDSSALGSAAFADTTDFASAAQGAKADTAVQPAGIADFVSSADVTDIVVAASLPGAPDATTLYFLTT